MTRTMSLVLTASIAVAFSACKTTENDAAPPSATVAGAIERADDGTYTRSNAVNVTATVEAIDHATRQVTLLGPDGKRQSFRVGEQVRNLDQVQKGDTVALTYYQSVMVAVKQPGEVTPGVSAAAGAARAEPGATPGAIGARSVTVVATVRALDRANMTATLDLGDGQPQTIAVQDPSHYDHVKVGDVVEITYTEALAIALEKTSAK